MVVPLISQDPRFLHRAAMRGERRGSEFSFVCVPIVLHRRVVGTLSIELIHKTDREFERLLKFLKVVASMISQGIRIHRLLEMERQKLVAENAQLRQELHQKYDFSTMVGSSGPMRQMYEEMARVAGSNTTVLIRGESGTGKELIASAIHYHSSRAKKPFIKVNCAALPETLIESELFGHERGAFTGAESRKKGRFEMANSGTLFLDEIGELSPATQAKLLRALQEREFERVGGTDAVRVDVRVIAATNRNLEKALSEGSFREDLYYRLNVFPIFIPPLRERRADILPLADHFAEKYAREHGKTIKRISVTAIDQLACYHWPGNVRELENTIERAVLMADGEVIHGHHLPPTLQTAEATGTTVSTSLNGAVATFERSIIEDALKSTRGNRAKDSRLLGTTERVMNYKVKKYGIDPSRLRT
jgi:Nif-specific regulatory protein